jgi:alginate O-acetyltransferase complex protein AlgJ
MTTTNQRGGPTDPVHDEELRRGIIHTRIDRGTALGLVAAFLLIIVAAPLTDVLLDLSDEQEPVLMGLFRRAPTRENLKQLEDDLDSNSHLRSWVQPRLQEQLTRFGRVGNQKAVVGRAQDGGAWLFYQPGVAYLAGPGFLSDDTIAARANTARIESGTELHPDPRPAILAFARALAARGIALVLFPVPDKAMLAPRELHGRDGGDTVANNPGFPRFLREMAAAGVAVFDLTPAALRPGEPPRFLIEDTHWTPAFMTEAARGLAGFISGRVTLPTRPDPGYTTRTSEVERVGDLVDMLKLPEAQRVFPARKVTLTEVLTREGTPFEPTVDADVLLLGDSFTNIYTQPAMGWGQAAGLGPQLALALRRPVDVIAQNDAGAFATRQLLARALAGGEDRLAGKKVVIWQFAMRELGVGDWKPIAWGDAAKQGDAR